MSDCRHAMCQLCYALLPCPAPNSPAPSQPCLAVAPDADVAPGDVRGEPTARLFEQPPACMLIQPRTRCSSPASSLALSTQLLCSPTERCRPAAPGGQQAARLRGVMLCCALHQAM